MPDPVQSFEVRAIGVVRSPLRDRHGAPRQADEGAPEALLVFDEHVAPALEGIGTGAVIELLTWLHQADRDTLQTRPRSDPDRPLTGVFATRSPDRPNPIGLHTVTAVDPAEVPTIRSASVTSSPASSRPAMTPINQALPVDPPPPRTSARSPAGTRQAASAGSWSGSGLGRSEAGAEVTCRVEKGVVLIEGASRRLSGGRSRWRLPQSRDRALRRSTHCGHCGHGTHLLPIHHDRRDANT
jgi:tRNA-Thr(GGU) m(6)t(6)A37 methyltransferase TsaA